MAVIYSDITVKLSGRDGNAFAILNAVIRSLRAYGVDKETIDKFIADAISSNYEHLLQVCMQWVNIV